MRDQAPAPTYHGLLRALHLDLQELTLTLETIDQTTITLSLTATGVATQLDTPASANDRDQPTAERSDEDASSGKNLATITGKLKSQPREGRSDGAGNPTAWAKLAAHEEGRDEAHMYSATFHRHTVALALRLEKEMIVTVKGYVRESADPTRMDGLSVFGVINYPGKQAG
jgi:hypothetical protein